MGASKAYRFNLQKPTTKWLSKGTVVIYMKIFINNTHPTNIYLNDLISYIIWDLKICLNTEIQVPSNCSPYVYKCVTHVLQLFTLIHVYYVQQMFDTYTILCSICVEVSHTCWTQIPQVYKLHIQNSITWLHCAHPEII